MQSSFMLATLLIGGLISCSSFESSQEKTLTIKALQEMGLSKYNDGDFEKALQDFNMAHKIDPKNSQISIYRALSLFEVGEKTQAIDDLNQICTKLKTSSACFASLSYLYFRNKSYQLSISNADLALQDPSYDFKHKAYLSKGASFLELGKREKALETLKKSVESYAGQQSCSNRMMLSRAHLYLGQFSMALNEASLAKSLCSSLFDAYVWQAWVLYKSARFNEAIEIYREARIKFSDPTSQAVIDQNISKLRNNDALGIPKIVL